MPKYVVTKQQIDVANALYAEDMSIREIASRIGIKEATIKFHLKGKAKIPVKSSGQSIVQLLRSVADRIEISDKIINSINLNAK